MTLAEILRNLRVLPGDATILAEKPWTPASRASVREIPTAVLSELEIDGQSYFLEVFIARDFWSELEAAGLRDETAFVERLITYATEDA